ncbi:hypothetical protein ACFLXK_02105 [Chloroflexota bacterium]
MKTIMRNRDLRNEYLFAQALSYISVGIFLLSYVPAAQAKSLILITGTLACGFALIIGIILIINMVRKCVQMIKVTLSIDSYLKPMIISLSFLTLPMSVITTLDKGYIELRLIFVFGWISLALLYMFVDLFRIIGNRFKIANDLEGHIYKLFTSLGFISSFLGVILVIIGIYDPDSAQSMLNLNKWSYDPMIWFAVALLCVFPILIFNQDEGDKCNIL